LSFKTAANLRAGLQARFDFQPETEKSATEPIFFLIFEKIKTPNPQLF
jgi:hypothetical protein